MGYGARDPLPSDATAADGLVIRLPSGDALAVGAASATRALALATETAARIERIEAYLNTATYAVAGVVTTAPTPPPFSGTTSIVPICTASVVPVPVSATGAAAIQTDRVKVDA